MKLFYFDKYKIQRQMSEIIFEGKQYTSEEVKYIIKHIWDGYGDFVDEYLSRFNSSVAQSNNGEIEENEEEVFYSDNEEVEEEFSFQPEEDTEVNELLFMDTSSEVQSIQMNINDSDKKETTQKESNDIEERKPVSFHKRFKNKNIGKQRCRAIKANGQRCGQQGNPKQSGGEIINGYCEYHKKYRQTSFNQNK